MKRVALFLLFLLWVPAWMWGGWLVGAYGGLLAGFLLSFAGPMLCAAAIQGVQALWAVAGVLCE